MNNNKHKKIKNSIHQINKIYHLKGSLTSLSTKNSNNDQLEQLNSDVLDHYKFLLMIRNQFLQVNPFKNDDDCLKSQKFKSIFDNLKYHYTELMAALDILSNDAKTITDIYKEHV